MKIAIYGFRKTRLIVIAYDITSPRRAYHVRKVLDSLQYEKQYSVYETVLGEGQFRGVLAELSTYCDFSSDLLAAWWPLEGLRLHWKQNQLMISAKRGEPWKTAAVLPQNIGNFVLCYDISDPEALCAVAKEVASEAVMVQRSVYWLRTSVAELSALLARCAPHLESEDRLWVYPLRSSSDLWNVGITNPSILPIATYHWGIP